MVLVKNEMTEIVCEIFFLQPCQLSMNKRGCKSEMRLLEKVAQF